MTPGFANFALISQSKVGERLCGLYPFPVATDPSKSDAPLLLGGKLLLADPSLRDGTFNRSVVLLAHHTAAEGATGLILNHPTGKVLGDYLKSSEFSALRHLPVHHGGPVMAEQLTFSAFWWSPKAGLRWSLRISAQAAIELSHKPGRVVRAFVGYSGWSPGQLENEMKRQAWIPLDPRKDLLGHQHDTSLWHSLMCGISPLHRILAEAPDDPFLN